MLDENSSLASYGISSESIVRLISYNKDTNQNTSGDKQPIESSNEQPNSPNEINRNCDISTQEVLSVNGLEGNPQNEMKIEIKEDDENFSKEFENLKKKISFFMTKWHNLNSEKIKQR